MDKNTDSIPVPWCEPDDCPSNICGGPHYEHDCAGGTTVVGWGSPCLFCDWMLVKKE